MKKITRGEFVRLINRSDPSLTLLWERIEEMQSNLSTDRSDPRSWLEWVTPKIPWENVRSTHVAIVAYDMTGQQVCTLAKVPRPKVKRVRTDEELLYALANSRDQEGETTATLLADIALELNQGKRLHDLCRAANISLEVEE